MTFVADIFESDKESSFSISRLGRRVLLFYHKRLLNFLDVLMLLLKLYNLYF